MKFLRLFCVLTVLSASVSLIAHAQSSSDAAKQAEIAKKIINKTSVDAYSIWGSLQTNSQVKDAKVQGGFARRIVAAGGGKPWEASAHMTFLAPVAKGDQLVAVIWMRCEPNADNSAVNVAVRMEGLSAPYAGTSSTELQLTPEWQMYQVKGVSPESFAKEAANLSIQFGTTKGTLLLGPAFVLNMGPSVSAPPAAAPAAPASSSKPVVLPKDVLNNPAVEAYSIWGSLQTNTLEKDATVQGGLARRVVATAEGKPWEVSAHSIFFAPVAKDDQLVASIWMKCEPKSDNSPTKVIVRMEGLSAPYPGTNSTELILTPEWKLYEVKGISPQAFDKNTADLGIQFGMSKATIWFGPATVKKLGTAAN